MTDPRTPVLVGGGQFTYRGAAAQCPAPIELCAIAARAAAADAGLTPDQLADADFLAVVGFTIDAPGSASQLPVPRAKNPPKALAKALGASPRTLTYTHPGGNTPQSLVNHVAERIAAGEAEFAVLAGAEFLGSLMKLAKAGDFAALAAHAVDDPDEPAMYGNGRAGCSPVEERHGLGIPANVYPMFENALRAHLGRSLADHAAAMGALMAPFTQVAAGNPDAWFPVARSAEELVTVSPANRMVGFPYPKYLNSIIQVDQSAAVLVMSLGRARALGIAEDRLVYLHGCSDTTELWDPLDRVDYYSSPAIQTGAREALAMAGKSVAELDFFDLYSCFPVAVELACREIGLEPDDPRGLTLTGGLPYFGGPGNNYVMHSIVAALHRCRAQPGSFGLVTANGWFLTKHAMGIYSTTPTTGPWQRRDPKAYQADIDALPHPERTDTPRGPATIETYTVIHAREGYRMGIVIGRDSAGRRFVANTPKGDVAVLLDLEAREAVGRTGTVATEAGRAVFVPDPL
jgi:acetyl-CoA C-acetyltransferase